MMGDIADNRQAVQRVVQDRAAWVFATARRRVKDAALAEDVTQAVFLLYWQRRPGEERPGKIAGWLYRAVRYCAANALRLRQIQQRHEREAAMQKKERIEGMEGMEAGWTEVEAELEGAMDRLSEKDREVVLLRFYEQRPLAEVGKALGISEEAARMRVQRALEKLRGLLTKKGISGTTAGLSAILVGNVVEQMPEGLAEKIVSAVGNGGGGTVAAGIAKGAMKMMTLAKVKVAAAVTAVLVTVGGAAVVVAQGTSPASARATQPAAAAPTTGLSHGPNASLTAEALLAGWESTYGSIRAMDVAYSIHLVERIPPMRAAGRPAREVPLVNWMHMERREAEECYRVRLSLDENGFANPASITEYSFDGQSTMEYTGSNHKGVISPGFRQISAINMLDEYLLRLTKRDFPPPVIDLFRKPLANGGQANVRVRPALERVAGRWCHVLEVSPLNAATPEARVWICDENSMLPMKCEAQFDPVNSVAIEVDSIDKAVTDTGTVWYPTKARKVLKGYMGTLTYELAVARFVPNPVTKPEEFRLQYPRGAWVYDKGLEIVYVAHPDPGKPGQSDVIDVSKAKRGDVIPARK